ncbi:MAG: hypothetical protein ABGW99_16630 [Zunongwangia sp.]|uniref:hypothetical protein n=1 Tax=Zunongwangia sp. TaxID=1965325 RepID=UPI0032425821
MKLKQWTLFIDMLGYGALNSKINNIETADKLLKFMNFNSKIFSSQDNDYMKEEYAKNSFNLYEFYEIQVLLISDSLVINYFPKEIKRNISEKTKTYHSANTLFIIIKRLQTFIYHCMLENKIFVRGGISDKFCLVKDNFAVGEGLIEAYKIESKISKYPRICLSKSILEDQNTIDAFNHITSLIYKKNSFLKEDYDGEYFLDYLLHNICEPEILPKQKYVKHSFFRLHKETIEFHLNQIKDKIRNNKRSEKIDYHNKNLEKYEWLKKYHNDSLEDKYLNKYIIK